MITTGTGFDPGSLGSLPANVHVERFVPQSLLLQHCDLVVSHAGFGTVLGAMQHGVPMVLACLAADHWYNAERCAELGLARVVGRGAQSAQGLSSLVRGALADDELQAGAAAMKAAFADLPDVSEAVPLLERARAREDAGHAAPGGCTRQPRRASGGVRIVPVRVLFTSMSAQSHIAPMLPFAREAARVGHDVVFATGPDAVAQVQGAGLQALPAGLSFIEVRRRYAQASGSELAGLSPQERLEHLLLHGLIGIAAPAMLEDLLPFARTWQPDLVIRNLGEPAAEVVATAAGVPHVIHGFSSPKSSYFATAHRAGLAELYEGCGIDPPSGDSRLATPYLDIWPEGLRPQAEDWQYPNMWPLRPENAIPLRTPAPRPAALDGLPYERTVYVTAGTTHNSTPGLLETMVAALHDEAVNVVVTIGPDGDLDRFGPQPEQCPHRALHPPEHAPAALRPGAL